MKKIKMVITRQTFTWLLGNIFRSEPILYKGCICKYNNTHISVLETEYLFVAFLFWFAILSQLNIS